MKKIVTLSELKSMLSKNNVLFTFKKKDGTEKEVIGTTNKNALDRIGVTFKNDGIVNTNDKTVRYFDVNKNEWRCLSVENNNTVTAEEI